MSREDLEVLFCFKIGKELEQFKDKIAKMDLDEIMARAYQVDTIITIYAYSARTAHPFRRNGAPFRFKLSKAQQVD